MCEQCNFFIPKISCLLVPSLHLIPMLQGLQQKEIYKCISASVPAHLAWVEEQFTLNLKVDRSSSILFFFFIFLLIQILIILNFSLERQR